MPRLVVRLAFLVATALLGVAGAGFARASAAALGDLVTAQLVPSAIPALLGPVNELGRNGWHCVPEQAAKARSAADAELPGPGPEPEPEAELEPGAR